MSSAFIKPHLRASGDHLSPIIDSHKWCSFFLSVDPELITNPFYASVGQGFDVITRLMVTSPQKIEQPGPLQQKHSLAQTICKQTRGFALILPMNRRSNEITTLSASIQKEKIFKRYTLPAALAKLLETNKSLRSSHITSVVFREICANYLQLVLEAFSDYFLSSMTTDDNTIEPNIHAVSFASLSRFPFHTSDIMPLLSRIR